MSILNSVRYWNYIKDYFFFCFTYTNKRSYNKNEKNYTITHRISERASIDAYNNLLKEIESNIRLISHYSYFHLYDKEKLKIFEKIFHFHNKFELKKKWIYLFDRYVITTSKYIKNKIKGHLNKIKNDFIIGMHIRTGYSDFGDRVMYFGGYNKISIFMNKSINICRNKDCKCKWIICTDNSSIYYIAMKNYSQYIYDYRKMLGYPSQLKHSIHYIFKPFNIYAATVLYEVEMLINCDVLILSRYSRISRFVYNAKKECKDSSNCIFIS